jgi:two-component system, response regulator PdtaR
MIPGPAAQGAADTPAAASAPTRILVVDDDRLVLATVTHGLSQAGFEVIDADNGDDAILLARQYRPALALLDIRMEGLSGFDVAEYLRQQLGTPFMFLSAFADEDTRSRVEELGAVAYLTKPLDVRQIVPAVQDALRRLRDGSPAAAAAAPTEPMASADSTSLAPRLQGPAALVAMAAGIVMHRHNLGRDAALERLRRAAAAHQRTLEAQCRLVVDAVEQLATTESR